MQQQTETVPVSTLVLDYTIYPRRAVNQLNVSRLVEALEAGVTLPPVLAERMTRRIIDGFHRVNAYLRVGGPEQPVRVLFKDYPDQATMFLDALEYNAVHGLQLSTYERLTAVQKAETLGLTLDRVADALKMTPRRLDEVGLRRSSRDLDGNRVVLKRNLQRWADTPLNSSMIEVNRRSSGQQPLVYVNQLINLLEADAINWGNKLLMERLSYLRELLAAMALTTSV